MFDSEKFVNDLLNDEPSEPSPISPPPSFHGRASWCPKPDIPKPSPSSSHFFPIGASSSHEAPVQPSCARAPSVMQKVLFAVKSIRGSLGAQPQCKALVVVPGSICKQYVHYLQDRFAGTVCVHPQPMQENTQVVVVAADACGPLASQLSSFGLLLLDHDFTGNSPDFAVAQLLYAWHSLDPWARPTYMDLYTLGQRELPAIQIRWIDPQGSSFPDECSADLQRQFTQMSAEGASTSGQISHSSDTEFPQLAKPVDMLTGHPLEHPQKSTVMESVKQSEAHNNRLLDHPYRSAVAESVKHTEAHNNRLLDHPYRSAVAELSVTNCNEIFTAYCHALMGDLFDATVLLKYSHWKEHRSNVLSAVRYPSPVGLIRVPKRQAQRALQRRPLLTICGDHAAGLSFLELQNRWYIYVAVLDIISHGYLNDEFTAASHVVAACQDMDWASLVNEKGSPEKNPKPLVEEALVNDPLHDFSWIPNQDAKTLLNELQQKMSFLNVEYQTTEVTKKSQNMFLTTVTFSFGPQVIAFKGEVCPRKKNAEQSAAFSAIKTIIRGGLPELVPPNSEVFAWLNAVQKGKKPALSVPKKGGLLDDNVYNQRIPVKPARMQIGELAPWTSWSTAGQPAVQYMYDAVRGGWQATLCIAGGDGGCHRFAGDIALSKKQSEETAARRALQALSFHGDC